MVRADRSRLLAALFAVTLTGMAAGQVKVPSFAELHHAWSSNIQRIVQERRILEPAADSTVPFRWIGVRERLWTTFEGGESGFRLEFAGLVDTELTPEEIARRQAAYGRDAGYLHRHAGFRVEDPSAAERNYQIIPLGTGVRARRPTWRLAVLPLRFGRTPWLLEVDQETSYPLYQAEYNGAGILVATLEVTSYESFSSPPPDFATIAWWKPRLPTSDHPTIADALRNLPAAPFTIPDPRSLPEGYDVTKARIVRNDLRPEITLVILYSDGLDEFFVSQTLNAPEPPIPSPTATGKAYAIHYYQDFNVAQYGFHWNGLKHLVVGRAGLAVLGSTSQDLLEQAVYRR